MFRILWYVLEIGAMQCQQLILNTYELYLYLQIIYFNKFYLITKYNIIQFQSLMHKEQKQFQPTQWTIQNLPTIIERTKLEEIEQEYKQMIVFLGCTREGKSTLVNFLAGVDLQTEEHQDGISGFSIEVGGQFQGQFCRIGHSYDQSQTIMPKFIKTQYNGQKVILCDCPGYSDSRGTVIDIYISYCFSKIFRSIKKLRVVLVTSLLSINSGAAQNFVNPLNRFAKSLINYFDLQSFSKALTIVFARCQKENNVEYFIKRLKNIQQKNKKLQKKSITLLEQCIKLKNITLFRKPTKEGDIFYQDKELILKKIFEQASVSMIDNIKLSLDPNSICALKEYFYNFTQIVNEKLNKNLKQLKKFYQKRFELIEKKNNKYRDLQKQNQIVFNYLYINLSRQDSSFQKFLYLLDRQEKINYKDVLFNSKLGLFIFYCKQNEGQFDTPLPQLQKQFCKFLEQLSSILRQKINISLKKFQQQYNLRLGLLELLKIQLLFCFDNLQQIILQEKRQLGRNCEQQVSVISKIFGGVLGTLCSFKVRVLSLPFLAYSTTLGSGQFKEYWIQNLSISSFYQGLSGIIGLKSQIVMNVFVLMQLQNKILDLINKCLKIFYLIIKVNIIEFNSNFLIQSAIQQKKRQ